MKLILGSTSKPRQQILRKLGFKFSVIQVEIDEKKFRAKDPKKHVLKLAHAKAIAIQKITPIVSKEGILVTCDQIAYCNGKILEKARDLKEAEKFIRSYSNNVVDNISAIALTNLATGKQIGGVDNLKIEFKKFDEKLVKRALAEKNLLSYSGATCFGHTFWQSYMKKLSGDKSILFGISVKLMKKLINEVK